MVLSLFKQKSKEAKFWDWFAENQSKYHAEPASQEEMNMLFGELSYQIKKINPGIVFDFSPLHENGVKEFTISADGMKDVFPVVQALIQKAPKLDNWQFNEFRQRVPGDDLQIRFGDTEIGYSDLFFRFKDEGDKLGIELHVRNLGEPPFTQNAVYILLDALIGEYDVTTKISWIDWIKLDENNIENLSQIIYLRNVIDEKKN